MPGREERPGEQDVRKENRVEGGVWSRCPHAGSGWGGKAWGR